jgi:hypothetical protein
VLARILESAESVGFIEEIKGKTYVSLEGAADTPDPPTPNDEAPVEKSALKRPDPKKEPEHDDVPPKPPVEPPLKRSSMASAILDDERRRRVFITHGKNRDLVEPIRKLLEYGELEPVVSVERQSVSKPVPEKVMDDMRGCGAAIIHVDADRTIEDQDGKGHVLLNPNVLIEIGAAMAFYGRRFILLVREGVKLPSNLQGLYEVRYEDKTLDAAATIRLLEAIKDIKNYSLPSEPDEDDS